MTTLTPAIVENLPTTISVLGIDYSITYVDKPSDVDFNGRESLWGQVDYWSHSIRVYNNGRCVKDVYRTLFHEVLHCIANAAKMRLNDDDMHNELDNLSIILTDVLFRNNMIKID